jgi:prophage antirepressor-like protein
MSNELSTFNFHGSNDVRVIVRDGDPWFVAADVCAVLEHSNPTMAIRRLDDDDKQVIDLSALNNNEGGKINSLGTIVSESGLYALILTSRKPEAKKFKKWVTAEVLPAIRKTGRYDIGASQIDPTALSRLDLIKIAMEAETERLALESRVKQMEPKVDGFDRLIEADGAVNLQSAAKALQQRPNKFCDWLRSLGWIYRRPGGSANLGYQDKVQCGYIRHKVVVVSREDGTEKVCEQALITPKGLAKLSLILNSEGAL